MRDRNSVRWSRWAAGFVAGGLLLVLLLDLITYQFRDTSPYSSYNIGGEYIGLRDPSYLPEYFAVAAGFVSVVAVVLLAGTLLLRRSSRLAAGPLLLAAGVMPFYLLFAFVFNPLMASRFETDAQSITQEGPGWYLPLRYLTLSVSGLATAALFALAVVLLVARSRPAT